MTPSHDETLRLLTLDLISPVRRVEQAQIDALTPADWTEILRMARQHRIAPMMRWQLQHAHAHLRVPPHVAQTLDHLHRRATARTMLMQRALLRVHDILHAAGIPFVALKGVQLAYCVYPHPALRPLGDIDILVRPEQADAARAALLAGGLAESPKHAHVPDEFQDTTQHQRPLLAGTVSIEVHRRMFHLDFNHVQGKDLTDDPSFWSRCVPVTVAGTVVPVPSPTDQFIHLMVHGVLDHFLSNGPLLLSDLALVATQEHVNWPAVRATITRLGLERTAALASALVLQYWGTTPFDTECGRALPPVGQAVLANALPLLLCQRHPGLDTQVVRELQHAEGPLAKARVLWAVACPPRITLAMAFHLDPHSPWLWALYPAWWWRHTWRRLKTLMSGKGAHLARPDADGFARLEDWLRAEPAPVTPERAKTRTASL